jgi:hypothetical protein
MRALSDWIPQVQPYLPNCPRAVMIVAIRQSAIDFCQKSMFWRMEMEPLITVAGIREYELDFPPETIVVSVRAMTYDGRPIKEKDIDELDACRSHWRTDQGTPDAFVYRDPATVLLSKEPQESVELAATLALKPTQTALTCGDILFDEYMNGIAAGAIAQLMLQPGKPWTQPQLAATFGASYTADVEQARVRATTGYGRRVVRRSRAYFF